MRKIDAALDHRITRYSDWRQISAERKAGREPGFRCALAHPQPGNWLHLPEFQSDRRSYRLRERRAASDLSPAYAFRRPQETGNGIIGARRNGASRPPLS